MAFSGLVPQGRPERTRTRRGEAGRGCPPARLELLLASGRVHAGGGARPRWLGAVGRVDC